MTDAHRPPLVDRRTLLLGAGAFGLVACTTGSTDAKPESPRTDSTSANSTTAGSETSTTQSSVPVETVGPGTSIDSAPDQGIATLTARDFEALPICTVLPASTAGPFPTAEQLDRRDVTEGYPGHPLRLGLRVVDSACGPVAGAQVEIWHTDASGDYSSYIDNGIGKDEGPGSTFTRGFQTSGDDGILEFMTIYPGWYSGRVVHVHLRVRVDDELVSTAQLYFDDAYTSEIFSLPPYAAFGQQDTTWTTDGLIGDPATDGTAITLRPAMTENGEGTLGLANVGIPS